jgi:hypothetical protein
MSEISRSAPAAPKSATAPAAANRGPAGKATEERGDVFSALLSLVAQTRAAPAGEASAGDSGAQSDETEADANEPAKDGSNNPVAQLLGWADPRSLAGGNTATGTAGRAPTTSEAAAVTGAAVTGTVATTIAAAGLKTDGASIDTTGMQTLATPEAINPAVVPPAANASAAAGATSANITSVQPLATQQPINPLTLPPAANTSAAADATKLGATSANITSAQPLAIPQPIDPAAPPPGANTAAARAAGAAIPAIGEARDARTSSTRRDAKFNTTSDTTASLRAPAPTWQPLTNASARATAAAGSGDTLRGRGATWANSTVSMDLSTAREADGVAGNAVSLTARLSAMLVGQAQADVAAPTPMLGATQDTGSNPAEAPSPADLLTSGEAAPEPESAQLSHWSTQHLRHAHLRLGEGALDSVDIRLSMQGQDLSVDFRTDNADIRQSLAQQANLSLAALLERSGIALADVSVGAQQQQRQPQAHDQGQGSEPQRGDGHARVGRGAAGRVEADPSAGLRIPIAQPLRADGSRPLDLFV